MQGIPFANVAKPCLPPKIYVEAMLIMALFVLSIGFFQDIMDWLVDVLNWFNKLGRFIGSRLNICRFSFYRCKEKCDVDGTQCLKLYAHQNGSIASWAMESSIIVVLNIMESVITCACMLGVIHSQNVQDQHVDDVYLTIIVGVECNWFGDLGVKKWLDSWIEFS